MLDTDSDTRVLIDILLRSRMTFKFATLLQMRSMYVYSVHDLGPFCGDAKSAFDAACHDDKK